MHSLGRIPHRILEIWRPALAKRLSTAIFLALVTSCHLAAAQLSPQAIATTAQQRLAATHAVEAGPLPGSAPLELTLHFVPNQDQRADLKQLLHAQLDPASPSFRHWLTPEQFGVRFGISETQLAALTSWLESQGFSVGTIAPSRQSIKVTGTGAAAQAAFAITLRRYSVSGTPFFANTAQPSLHAEFNGLVSSVSGLDDLPSVSATRITVAAAGQPVPVTPAATSSPDPLTAIASQIDANSTPVINLTTAACSSDLASSEIDGYRALLDQAAAQGITVLVAADCQTTGLASVPAALAQTIAYTTASREQTTATAGIDPRPTWQAAPGLPSDTLRHTPDLAVSSGEALAQTVVTLVREQGTRLGNIAGTLYVLASTPGLYTQPDTAPRGAWEPATGLGLVDLAKLLKAFPRIAPISTSTSLISDNYSVHYGQAFTLTAQVQPAAYGNASPSGTVTFSSSTQGVLGSAGIDGSGRATFTSGVLPVGPNSITATYQGDGNYSGSASNPPVGVYISLVNASLTAVVNPSVNIPYGALATVTATVTLPYLLASPSGPVTAQISSGTPNSATLSPNPGSNSATANIDLNVPPPGHYSVQVTCQGTTNFQCQTPVNLPISVVKGYTSTTVSVTPASPQAGQPVSLTATVVNSGNGTGSYTYGGAITFFDSGRPIATVPVATNQATTQVSLSGNRTHNIIATYTGDSNWNASTSNAVAVTPTILPDALTLSSNVSGSSSLAGVNIIFTGTVTTNITYSSGPTGTLTFFDTFNGAVIQLGNPTALVPNGSAASFGLFTTTGLQPGVHSIYVQYSGDGNYAPATSAVLSLSLSSFSLTMTPTSLTVSQGKSAQVSVIVTNSGGFSGSVSLGCTPPSSSQAICAFSPASITGPGSANLTITTAAPQAIQGTARSMIVSTGWHAAAGLALAGLGFAFLPRRRRTLPSLLTILLAVSLAGGSGCGTGLSTQTGATSGSGSSGSGPVASGTPLGTGNYTITAAGSDGVNTVRHTYQYQVTVQ